MRPSVRRQLVLAALALRRGVVAAQDLLIRNARVITCAGPELDGQDIRIENGKIAEIGPQALGAVPRADDRRARTRS